MKVLVSFLVLLIILPAYGAVYNLQHDDGTLSQAWFGSFYRGVRFYVSDSCTLNSVSWGRYTKRTETDTIFIYTDSANAPNKLLYSKPYTLNTGSTQQVLRDTVTATITVSQKFWMVMYSRTQDSPSSQLSYFISDAAGVGNSFWQDTTGDWVQNSGGDYIMRMSVRGPLGLIMLSESEDTVKETFGRHIYDVSLENGNITSNGKLNTLKISLAKSSAISIYLADYTGRIVQSIKSSEFADEGTHTISWKAESLSSGVYFLMVRMNGEILSEKIIITK